MNGMGYWTNTVKAKGMLWNCFLDVYLFLMKVESREKSRKIPCNRA